MSAESYALFETWVNALTVSDLNALLRETIAARACKIIANHNLHSLYVYHHDRKMRDFYAKAAHIHVDGMAMVILGKFLGLPLKREHRVTYADWIYSIMDEANQHRWRVFYLGSKPGVADRGAERLRQQYPSLQIETAHGYFDAQPNSADSQQIVEAINQYRPHILLVGMSMPRQEHWILDNLDRLQANVVLPSGAAIDYVAGCVPTPPRWAGKWGLEWLFRLVAEPRRLWQRYLVEPWFILKLLFLQYLKRLF
ncbi:MAG: WecB/TagA/CpsF family glycosyltransferase [Leptolyngbya sp. SIO4C1]|nr:WecB/TagA/CpsF family glycosyltransferase [Leptolyngbya sp. SIO4C1]